jgi:cell division protein FtsI (penicillin-binding protein 3)
VNSKETDWVVSDTLNKQVVLNRRQLVKGRVPDVTGMSAKDAIYLLESMGLVVQFNGLGRVTNQSLGPGTELFEGMLIKIELQ